MNLSEYYRHPGYLIRRCHQIVLGMFEEAVAPYSTTVQQLSILHAVSELEGTDQGSIAEAIGMDRSTIAAIADRLVSRGLLGAQPGRDRRRKRLSLTPAGRELLEELLGRTRRLRERFLSPLTPAEQQTFIDLLSRVANAHNAASRVPQRLADDPAA